MNDRYLQMKSLLEKGQFFKLICGAGNENATEVYRLALIYTLAGAKGFDVSASPEIVKSCVLGIDAAYGASEKLQITIEDRPFITVSVGMPGDHHVRKASIIEDCVECTKCIPVCPTDAIPDTYEIIQDLCIGCGNCEAACPPKVAAVRYTHNGKALRDLLPKCIAAGAENIELHAAVPDDNAIMEEWQVVSESQPNNYVSMCLDRYHLTNHHLVERIRMAKDIAGDRLIIQADGVPMSGGSDDLNTTLQAVAIADVIQKDLVEKDKKFKNLPILLSGGTNSYTGELANSANIKFSGISMGTHARKIVKGFIDHQGLEQDLNALSSAVKIAQELINKSMRYVA